MQRIHFGVKKKPRQDYGINQRNSRKNPPTLEIMNRNVKFITLHAPKPNLRLLSE